MRGLCGEDCYQSFLFLQEAALLIYHLNGAQHVLTGLQRNSEHLPDHLTSLSADERIVKCIVGHVWFTGREDPGRNTLLLWPEAKSQKLIIPNAVGGTWAWIRFSRSS